MISLEYKVNRQKFQCENFSERDSFDLPSNSQPHWQRAICKRFYKDVLSSLDFIISEIQ